jgi:hypothetical protein
MVMNVFDLPDELLPSARNLLREEQAHRRRAEMEKRFARGFTRDELDGFLAGDRPLTRELLEQWGMSESNFEVRSNGGTDGNSTGDALPDPYREMNPERGESWIRFTARLLESFRQPQSEDTAYFSWLKEAMHVHGVPDWAAPHASAERADLSDDHGVPSRPAPSRGYRSRSAPFEGLTSEFNQASPRLALHEDMLEKAHFYRDLVQVSQYREAPCLLPVVYFKLPEIEPFDNQNAENDSRKPPRYLGIMPWLTAYITLHDLICAHAGLPIAERKDGDALPAASAILDAHPRSDAEARLIFKRLAEVLDRYLAIPCETQQEPNSEITKRFADRLKEEHKTPVILGSETLQACRTLACEITQREIGRLVPPRHVPFGHGDLNATNIMIAVQREPKSGEIREVDVRLIDPNPTGRPFDAALELARLLHWMELGLPLRINRAAGKKMLHVNFGECTLRKTFECARPVIEFHPPAPDRLQHTYSLLWEALCETLTVVDPHDDRTLTRYALGVSLYHLVGAKYWPNNVERTAAFLCGIGELERLHGTRRPLGLPLLRDVRRRGCNRLR